MKEMTINTKVLVCTLDELSPADREVVDAARAATANSYAVYSHFNVGAAVRLAGGTIVCGTNQENAAYPSGLCAERTTLFWANSQYPTQAVEVLAIAARTDQGELTTPIPPCGACRQVILETEKRFNKAIRIILYGAKECYIIEEGVKALLPLSFDAGFLE
ncbi:MAG: cytidine deaminase [Bacteroidaceae bacterium]|nr:cytidine deaminase [Bacteroidaceae bacterium]